MKNHFTVHGKAKTQTAKESKKMFKELDAIFLNKSQHTQGEWKGKERTRNFDAHPSKEVSPYMVEIAINGFAQMDGSGLIAKVYGKTEKQTEANAQRIIKGVNAISEIEKNIAILEKHRSQKQISSNGLMLLAIYTELLKQAE